MKHLSNPEYFYFSFIYKVGIKGIKRNLLGILERYRSEMITVAVQLAF